MEYGKKDSWVVKSVHPFDDAHLGHWQSGDYLESERAKHDDLVTILWRFYKETSYLANGNDDTHK